VNHQSVVADMVKTALSIMHQSSNILSHFNSPLTIFAIDINLMITGGIDDLV